MTGDRSTDGGLADRSLFASFPDPLLAYATDDGATGGEGPTEAADGSLVCRAVNPAFESIFGVPGDDAAGAPLVEIELRGTVSRAGGGARDSAGGTDPLPVESDATAEAASERTSASSAATTARSVLEAVSPPDGAVRFHAGSDGDPRVFRVRAITGEATDCDGHLLFTEVTELAARRRDLASEVERLERIASVVSHDLRNPLEVATIRLEAARDTGDDVHFEKVAGALDRIEHIVRDVLAVGGGSVEPSGAVSLADTAEAAWDTVDTAEATLEVATDLPTVRGDADRLRQLFENLFRNAVEHGRADVSVRVEALPDGFAVADDGPGVPEDVRERIFEAGYTTAAGNSGLGLSIVRRIAREHGWDVSLAPARTSGADGASSAARGGARFAFAGVDRLERDDGA
jgi:signal transduction histidine kinase